MKFTEECVQRSMFLAKNVYKWVKHGFATTSLSQKRRVETCWFSSKESVVGTAVNKEGHADSLLGYERNHHNGFPWKRYNCN